MDDVDEVPEPQQPKAEEEDQERETWDWARAAGVSREDLLRALRLARPR